MDEPLYDLRVSERQKEKIRRNARIIDRLSGSFMMVRHTGEDRAEINSIEDASFGQGKVRSSRNIDNYTLFKL